MSSTILIADDHPICGTALTMAVKAVERDAEVVVAPTLAAAEGHLRGRSFDLILLDLILPDAEGLTGLLLLRQLQPQSVFAIVSSRDDTREMRRAAALGARGYILKSSAMDDIVIALQALLGGGQYFPDDVFLDADTGDDEITRRFSELSGAQIRVLRTAAAGGLNKEIAHTLGVSETTIKSHFAAIFKKLGVINRTQAVLAMRSFEAAAVR